MLSGFIIWFCRPRRCTASRSNPDALDDDVPSMRSPFPVKPSLLTLYAQFVLTCKKIEILLAEDVSGCVSRVACR